MERVILEKIKEIFMEYPKIKFGFTKIDFSKYSKEYKCALIFAVPYSHRLSVKTYNEQLFEKSICDARIIIDEVVPKLEAVFKESRVKYFVPPTAQNNEDKLVAPFSFKYAAVNAGLGWIGKNDVLITENGPMQRLSAILLDADIKCGQPIKESRCPDKCTKCVSACPHKALKGVIWNIKSKRQEIVDYHLCNKKRSLFIEKLGRKSSCGLCLVSCPYGLQEK